MERNNLAEFVMEEIIAQWYPLGIQCDSELRIEQFWGNFEHYGFFGLTKGTLMTQFLPLLEGMFPPLSIHLPFVEMPNGRCANIQLRLDKNESHFIFTDDTGEKLRYQELRQATNDMVLGAYRRVQAEEALYREKELAEVTLKSIGDAVIRTDQFANVTYMNPLAETMTGWSCAEAYGQHIDEIFVVRDATTKQPVLGPIQLAIIENQIVGLAMNAILINRSGKKIAIEDSAAPIHSRRGEVIGAVLVFHDVSEARAMAIKMSHLAQHDYLTGLPNRVMLHDRLTQAIGLAQRHSKGVAVLFLDLDRFKYINDSLGHLVGDKLLKEISRRLKNKLRRSDSISRQGGDEFIVLLSEVDSLDHVVHIADSILNHVAQPYDLEGDELSVTLSIGVSLYPDDGIDASTLIKNADAAMYHAKENGRNNIQFFTKSMHDRSVARREISNGLRQALKKGELELYYQPKFQLEEQVIVGFEALLRWVHPKKGLIEPDVFIPIAEESGFITALGEWVLRQACLQNKRWQEEGLPHFTVAVNISPVQFRERGFVKMVKQALNFSRLNPRYLELELTETIIMQDVPYATGLLEELKAMGIKLSVDDFGTGYSSLAYLKKFPIDTLKIDQSFVHDISSDQNDAAIVLAVIRMAKSLKQTVIAEGVETLEQLQFLSNHGCDEIQGYYFSRPLSVQDTRTFIDTRKFS